MTAARPDRPRAPRTDPARADRAVASLHKTLEQELLAVLRGASLECPVCGEFVLHEGTHVRCPECGMTLHGRVGPAAGQEAAGFRAG